MPNPAWRKGGASPNPGGRRKLIDRSKHLSTLMISERIERQEISNEQERLLSINAMVYEQQPSAQETSNAEQSESHTK